MITLNLTEHEFGALLYKLGFRSPRASADSEAWISFMMKIKHAEGESGIREGSRADRIWEAVRNYQR